MRCKSIAGSRMLGDHRNFLMKEAPVAQHAFPEVPPENTSGARYSNRLVTGDIR